MNRRIQTGEEASNANVRMGQNCIANFLLLVIALASARKHNLKIEFEIQIRAVELFSSVVVLSNMMTFCVTLRHNDEVGIRNADSNSIQFTPKPRFCVEGVHIG
mmetsp:Transcript_3864/g.5759  ORF Transcript_3864/g.5759 Transcript_3864/m.5759 type:complete len:104 (-) Transcript_3864:299-610(-)